jgi:hypothetical protein
MLIRYTAGGDSVYRPTLPLLSLLALVAAGCADPATPATRPSASTQSSSATRPALDPAMVAKEIDSIIYSDTPKDQMLEKLKPFVAIMDSKDDFTKKTGLEFGFGFGSGPGVTDYSVKDCGLSLVVDPDQKIRIIRRGETSVNGKDYPQMSISEAGFEWNGYSRWYPN